jgi:carbon monoxide dehydrogenase subunit G
MKITGNYTFQVPRARVWPRIFDPTSLLGLIPGCKNLEQIGPREYRGQIQINLAAVSGSYDTLVEILERQEPDYCRFRGEVDGPTGFITGTAAFTLREVQGKTILDYEAQGIITGALAKLSPRFVQGIVKTLINQGLARLNKELLNGTLTSADGRGKAEDGAFHS